MKGRHFPGTIWNYGILVSFSMISALWHCQKVVLSTLVAICRIFLCNHLTRLLPFVVCCEGRFCKLWNDEVNCFIISPWLTHKHNCCVTHILYHGWAWWEHFINCYLFAYIFCCFPQFFFISFLIMVLASWPRHMYTLSTQCGQNEEEWDDSGLDFPARDKIVLDHHQTSFFFFFFFLLKFQIGEFQ